MNSHALRRRASSLWPTAAAVLCLTAVAGAQEERAIDNFAGLGARAMGMGGAYVGVADDFTAVWWNPAGLAQIQRREVHVAFARNALQNDATIGRGTPTATQASADVSNTRFGSLGAVYPWPVARGSFVMAAGYNRVKDFDWVLDAPRVPVLYSDAGAVLGDSVAYDDSFRHEGEMSVTSLAAAVDVSPSVSLGMTVSLISGQDDRVDLFRDVDTEDFFLENQWYTRRDFADDYRTTWMATFGALVRAPRDDPRVRLGLSVSTGPTHKISYTLTAPDTTAGFSTVEYDGGSVDRFGTYRTKGSYKVNLPMTFSLGASLKPHPDVLVAASVHLAEWTQSEYESAPDIAERLNDFEVQYDDIMRTHLGVEWRVPWVALDLRAGTYTDPLPFIGPRDPTLEVDAVTNPPVRIVQDRRFWTLGAGVLLDQAVQADLAWVTGSYEQAEGLGAEELREDVSLDRWFAAVVYRF